jgi:hypothetical protein
VKIEKTHPAWLSRAGSRAIPFVTSFILVLVLAADAEPAEAPSRIEGLGHCRGELRLPVKRIRFDLCSDSGLRKLVEEIETTLETAGPSAEASDQGHRELSGKEKRGLKELRRLAMAASAAGSDEARAEVLRQLQEVAATVNNNQRPAAPSNVDILGVPILIARNLHRRVLRGDTPATNLETNAGRPEPDLSRLDPKPSSFWRRPTTIAEQDLYTGFGRAVLPAWEDVLYTYDGPKDSSGLNPGFEVTARNYTLKIKFGEVSSEPFAARIFAALGYHVDPTDHVREVKIRYDRRLFHEFHSRKEVKVKFSVLGVIPLGNLRLQRQYDPFQYIKSAVLRDGSLWSGPELKQQLFHDPHRPHPEVDLSNFRPEIEERLDYLVTQPANLQIRRTDVDSLGPWDFGQLDHADRRELRGLILLAAWVGWYDTRFDNTRLKLARHSGHREQVHYLTDLGGALGKTSGFVFWRGEQPDAFPWSFTRAPRYQGKGRMTIPFRIAGYRPIADTPAFTAATVEDARWMARLIGQLREAQIVEALMAAGYDSATVQLYTEKLAHRRDRMIQDLGLGGEIAPWRPGGVDRLERALPTDEAHHRLIPKTPP